MIEPWCTGKTKYPNKARAIERIDRQANDKNRGRKRQSQSHMTLVPYLCKSCHCWHVGGTNSRAFKAKHHNQLGHLVRKPKRVAKEEERNGVTVGPTAQGRQAPLSALWPKPQA